MAKSFSRGTPEQLIHIAERRIEELGGEVVESSQEVCASEKTYIDQDGTTTFTLEELRRHFEKEESQYHPGMTFENWVSQALEDGYLQEVDSSTNTCNIGVNPEVVEGAVSGEDHDEYMDTLMESVESKLSDKCDNVTFNRDEDQQVLCVTVIHGAQVSEYSVPYEDMKWDKEQDEDYIVSAISADLESGSGNIGIECPKCHNHTLYDTEKDAKKLADLDYGDLCTCDECGAELIFKGMTYDNLPSFEDAEE